MNLGCQHIRKLKKKVMKYMNLIIFAFSLLFTSCSEKIVDGSKLPQSIITHIQKLGILEKEEPILYFYTSFNNKASGNFITEKRLASYWQNNSPKDDYIRSAYYNEINSISVKYGDGFEFTSALVIELNDGQKFDVYFCGTKEEIDKLHKEVIKLWKK
jgi:hypothetical protein